MTPRSLRSSSLGAVAAYVGALAFAACAPATADDAPETGGAGAVGAAGSGVGGSRAGSGAGGAPGSGGSAGSGSGGTTGSAGSNGVGGTAAGSGGSSTGGSGGVATGGSAGSASGGAAGGAVAGAGGSAGTGIMSGGRGGLGGAGSGGGAGASGGAAGRAGAGGGGGAGGAPSTCPAATPLTGGKQYCSNTKGNAGGYAYELWAEGSGQGCMTVFGKDANFSATWTGVEDFLARSGLGFDQTKTHSQIGDISADFAETKTAESGLVYVGIYGWTLSPLREYYILDDWGSSKPGGTASDGTPRDHVGTFELDGDTYVVWKHTRTDKPAINGDHMTFDQYFSVRQNARQCGHISISGHFKNWEKLGLSLGKLEEAKLLLEAQDGSGSIAFTTATVVVK